MKNLIPFLTIFLSALVISCTVATYNKKAPPEPPQVVVLNQGLPAPAPVNIIKADSGKPERIIETNTIEKTKEVAVLDTATLSIWFKKFEDRLDAGEKERAEFAEIMNGYRQALQENTELLLKYSQAKQEKAVVQETATAAQKVMVDVPTIMYGILIILMLAVAFRQQYLKVKIERQISNIRSCRIENQIENQK